MGALLDGQADLLHLGGTGVSGKNLSAEDDTHDQRHDGDDGDDHHQREVRASHGHGRSAGGSDKAWHSVLLKEIGSRSDVRQTESLGV